MEIYCYNLEMNSVNKVVWVIDFTVFGVVVKWQITEWPVFYVWGIVIIILHPNDENVKLKGTIHKQITKPI